MTGHEGSEDSEGQVWLFDTGSAISRLVWAGGERGSRLPFTHGLSNEPADRHKCSALSELPT